MCEIESETGRISVYVYGDAFSSLRPKERIWDAALAETILGLASEMSFEKTVANANRFLHRGEEDALRKKTVEEFVERTGKKIGRAYSRLSDAILSDHGIDTGTGIPDPGSRIDGKAVVPTNAATADKESVEERVVEVEGGVPGLSDADFSSIEAVSRTFSAYIRGRRPDKAPEGKPLAWQQAHRQVHRHHGRNHTAWRKEIQHRSRRNDRSLQAADGIPA